MTTFYCFGLDKRRARRRQWRIPEKRLFLLSLLGGGIGAWIGMYYFHHKTKRWHFVYLIPLMTLFEYGILAWGMWRWMH